MPKIGQAMTEGTVVAWHCPDGAEIRQGEVLVTIETDKSTYDLDAPATGTVHILVAESEEVGVGAPLAVIGEGSVVPPASPPPPSAAADRPPSAAAGSEAAPAGRSAAPRGRDHVLASPRARRVAAERGVDLATVTPGSADGVISVQDVERAAAAAAGSGLPGRRVRERRPLRGIRRASVRRVSSAWQSIPHIVQMVDVDATGLKQAQAAERERVRNLTINDLILRAAAETMGANPDLNAGIDNSDTLVLYERVDVGCATETPRGLVVPVIRNAEELALSELVAERERLVAAARDGRLDPADVGDASLTVSNLGMFGVAFGTPIINLGEPLLVFVGTIEDRAVVRDGAVVARPMLTLSIAYDHRIADGVPASRFTQGLRQNLEGLGKENTI